MAIYSNRAGSVGSPYLERTDSPVITAWTMCGWFYFTSDADHQTVFGIGDGTHYAVIVRDTGGAIAIATDGAGGSLSGFPLNQWLFIAFTLNGANSNLYIAKAGDSDFTNATNTYTGSWTPTSLSVSTAYAPDGSHMYASNVMVFSSALGRLQLWRQAHQYAPANETLWAWWQLRNPSTAKKEYGNNRDFNLTGSFLSAPECAGFWDYPLDDGQYNTRGIVRIANRILALDAPAAALGASGWEAVAGARPNPLLRQQPGPDIASIGPFVPILGKVGWEPASPRTRSAEGVPGPNVDGVPPFVAPLGSTGWEPFAPNPVDLRPPQQGFITDAGGAVASLRPGGWEPRPPSTIERPPPGQGVSADPAGAVAGLYPTGWEPPPPVTVSPRGKAGVSFDRPLLAWLYAGGWEPPSPVTVSPRGRMGVNYDGPMLAFLYPSGWEPPAPRTVSPRGKAGTSFDGAGLLAGLGIGGWESAAPTPLSPRGRQGVSFDATGLFAVLGASGWEPPGPQTVSPRGRGAVNFDGPFIPFLYPGGWEAAAPLSRALRASWPALEVPQPPFVAPLLSTGWEPPSPRTLSPRAQPGENFAGWTAFGLRSSGFEPPAPWTVSPRGKAGVSFEPRQGFVGQLGATGWEPLGPRTTSPAGKLAPSFDGPLVPFQLRVGGWEPPGPTTRTPRPGIGVCHDPFLTVIVILAPEGWQPASPRTTSPRGALGASADAGILVPPRPVTGWEPSSPYLPRAPRPGVGVNFDGHVRRFLAPSGWEPESPRTHSPRGLPGPNYDGPWLAFLRASGWEPESPRTHTPVPGQGVAWWGPMAGFLGRTGWEPAQPRNRWIPPGWGGFEIEYSGLIFPPSLLAEFLYGPPAIAEVDDSRTVAVVENSVTGFLLTPYDE